MMVLDGIIEDGVIHCTSQAAATRLLGYLGIIWVTIIIIIDWGLFYRSLNYLFS